MGKQYSFIDPANGNIQQCAYSLPLVNIRCWVAGNWNVTDTPPNAVGAVPLIYQLCDRHKQIQEDIDAGILNPPPYPPQP